ncbi:hypothetical protein X961_5676 [Burkholderia pseudomallei MSHR5613]|nr:hypothetical protein X961_5676 [Burkholderia pseudomallei MSHR5613]
MTWRPPDGGVKAIRMPVARARMRSACGAGTMYWTAGVRRSAGGNGLACGFRRAADAFPKHVRCVFDAFSTCKGERRGGSGITGWEHEGGVGDGDRFVVPFPSRAAGRMAERPSRRGRAKRR